jgi:hypothetical protein
MPSLPASTNYSQTFEKPINEEKTRHNCNWFNWPEPLTGCTVFMKLIMSVTKLVLIGHIQHRLMHKKQSWPVVTFRNFILEV